MSVKPACCESKAQAVIHGLLVVMSQAPQPQLMKWNAKSQLKTEAHNFVFL
jgi:hypothetical protein